jgi:hypothetical protein
MLDKKNPLTMTMFTFVVAFCLLIGILYLAQPTWVQIDNQNTGKGVISWKLVISYSATFSLVCSIAVMIMMSKNRENENDTYFPIDTSFPAPTMAASYCGVKQ